MNEYDLGDPNVAEFIKENPKSLEEFVPYIFEFDKTSLIEENLTKLSNYVYEVGNDAIALFERYLEFEDAKINYQQPNLTISLSGEQNVSIDLSEKAQINFLNRCKLRKLDLHLLPELLDKFQDHVEINNVIKNIQQILNNCITNGFELTMLFRDSLDESGIRWFSVEGSNSQIRLGNGNVPKFLYCNHEEFFLRVFHISEGKIISEEDYKSVLEETVKAFAA